MTGKRIAAWNVDGLTPSDSERVQANAESVWESERKTLVSRIDVLEAKKRSMAEMLDTVVIQSQEKQGQLDAARVGGVEQEEKRNLLEAEVASLQSEVVRLNAATAPAASIGLYTEEQLQQAIESTVVKDKEHFEARLAYRW